MATFPTPTIGDGGSTVVGSYLVRIDNFSGTKDLGIGEKIELSAFRVGGYSWRISCYPCGADEQSAGWASLSLSLVLDHPRAMAEVKARCMFTIMEEEDKKKW